MPIRRTSRHAPQLRRDMTDAERTLWAQLRGRRLQGYKFKRQWTIGTRIADFCCSDRLLVVEVDGSQHNDPVDAERTREIESFGYRILRFWNNDVLTNMDGVLVAILLALEGDRPSPPAPLPQAGEGR